MDLDSGIDKQSCHDGCNDEIGLGCCRAPYSNGSEHDRDIAWIADERRMRSNRLGRVETHQCASRNQTGNGPERLLTE